MITTVSKWICAGLVVASLALGVDGCGRSIGYAADWTTVHVPSNTFVTTAASATEKEYKSRCQHISWRDVRDNKTPRGEDVYFKGPVFNVGSAVDWPFLSAYPAALGTVALGLGRHYPDGFIAAVYVLWPGQIPGLADPQVGAGPVVEVWGDSQGPDPTQFDIAIVRARYLTVH